MDMRAKYRVRFDDTWPLSKFQVDIRRNILFGLISFWDNIDGFESIDEAEKAIRKLIEGAYYGKFIVREYNSLGILL